MKFSSFSGYLVAIGATVLLSACPLTDEDKERIDAAEDNLQKIALDPKIVSPSDQEVVYGIIDVEVDVDDSVTYEKVTLQVGAQVIAEDTEAPFVFEIDTANWAEEEKIALLVKAYMTDGNQLRSEVVNLILKEHIVEVNAPVILSPSNDETVNGTFQVVVDADDVISYKTVELLEGGNVIAVDNKTPYEFNLDSYFFATEEKIALTVNAIGNNGKTYKSGIINAIISPKAKTNLVISTPAADATFEATDTVEVSWNEIPSATGYQVQLNDDTPVDVDGTTIELPFDEFDKHQVKVRAKSPQGNWGVWSENLSFSTGLFAYAVDVKATAGWYHNDSPIDFIIGEDDFVILSSGSDQYDDGSGDSSNVALTTIKKGYPFASQVTLQNYRYPDSFVATDKGYMITASPSYGNGDAVVEVGPAGQILWSYTKTGQGNWNSEGTPYTSERISSAIPLDEQTVLVASQTYDYEYYKSYPNQSYWQSKLVSEKLAFEQVKKTDNSVIETVVEKPSTGKYSSVNHFLITETDIKAVGRFTSESGGNDGSADLYNEPTITQSGSGAVVFSLSKTGELDTSKTKTGGGLAYESIYSVAQSSTGDLLVGWSGYNRSGITEFYNSLSYSVFTSYSNIKNGRVAAHSSESSYLIAGGGDNPSFARSGNGNYATPFTGYGSDLAVKAIKHDPRYGYVILATTEAPYDLNSRDSYTVLFNISDSDQYIVPTKLIEIDSY